MIYAHMRFYVCCVGPLPVGSNTTVEGAELGVETRRHNNKTFKLTDKTAGCYLALLINPL